MLYLNLLILAVLIFALALVVVSMRDRVRNQVPTVVSPAVARRHIALICLICWPQILLAAALTAVVVMIVVCFLLSINPFQRQSAYSEAYSVAMWIIALLVAAAIIAKSIDRHRKSETRFFRDILRVNTNTISTFAFIFAAFAAHDVYQLMPPWKSHPHMSLSAHFLNRDFLWIAVFLLGRSCVITILKRVLELNLQANHQAPPQNPEPPGQSGSGPYVPFDPYHLPNNPPLRPSIGGT